MLERLGIAALGLFVGLLLARGLARSEPTLRNVLTVLGAALGGAPLAFVKGAGAKWIYPVGLIAGYLIANVHFGGVDRATAGIEQEPSLRLFQFGIDVRRFVVGFVVAGLVAFAVWVPNNTTIRQKGSFRMGADISSPIHVYYPTRFDGTPYLSIAGPSEYELISQSPDGFVIKLEGYSEGETCQWEAVGSVRPE